MFRSEVMWEVEWRTRGTWQQTLIKYSSGETLSVASAVNSGHRDTTWGQGQQLSMTRKIIDSCRYNWCWVWVVSAGLCDVCSLSVPSPHGPSVCSNTINTEVDTEHRHAPKIQWEPFKIAPLFSFIFFNVLVLSSLSLQKSRKHGPYLIRLCK